MSALTPLETRALQESVTATQTIREYLSFRLGDEEYGIDILCVQEIRSFEKPTRMAGAPALIHGVLNLRGVIVPVADLRLLMGAQPRFDAATVTVVLNLAGRTVGAVVDSVSDVVSLGSDQIRPAPSVGGHLDAQCITGIGNPGQSDQDRMLILLDIERLLCSPNTGLGLTP